VGYEEGNMYLDIGVGAPRFGLVNNYLYNSFGYNSYSIPVLVSNLEYGFTDLVSGGVYAGYSHYGWRWTETTGEWDERYSYLSLGFRGTFHIWNFINNNLELGLGLEELDFYASLMIGAQVESHSNQTPSSKATVRKTRGYAGATVGGKYYFSPRTAVFLEGGYGSSSFGILGLTFKI